MLLPLFRIEELKHQFHNFIVEPIALMKKRKLLYKKAFLARCQNLKLAETEVPTYSLCPNLCDLLALLVNPKNNDRFLYQATI